MSGISPWDEEPPKYKEVPQNKTESKNKIRFFLCSKCGAAVINRKLHNEWHSKNSYRNF